MKVFLAWPQFFLAARGTAAALLALAVAVHLQLECPYWAAMTALIVIQPTRGLLLEKSFYRLVGTAVGSLAGMIMLAHAKTPATLTLALCAWLAGCVGAGNLLYGLRSYGALVAACTGAVIAVAGFGNPQHLHGLVFARIACIVVGIVVATTVTLFFTRQHPKREVLDRLTKVAAADLLWLSWLLQRRDEQALSGLRLDILVEVAEIEGSLDAVWAGSFDLKRRQRQVRGLILSLLTLLETGMLAGDRLKLPGAEGDAWRLQLAGLLAQLACQLDEQGTLKGDLTLQVVAATRERYPLMGRALVVLVNSLKELIENWDDAAPSWQRPAHLFIRHRDWREAGRAALRAGCAMAAVGALWRLTGWGEGPLMLLAASFMVSFFSTQDRPSVLLTRVFLGASVGIALAFLFRLVLFPGAISPLEQGLVCVPVLLAGILALSWRRTAMGAMDAMLFFLLVMQPGVASLPATLPYLEGGGAALAGVGVAILAFRFLLPVDPARRLNSLLTAIIRDLAVMATADLRVLAKCRARIQHRVLRMLVTAGKFDSNLASIVTGGVAALVVGRSLQLLRGGELGHAAAPETASAVAEAALWLSDALQHPESMLFSLEVVSYRVSQAVEPYLDVIS